MLAGNETFLPSYRSRVEIFHHSVVEFKEFIDVSEVYPYIDTF